MKFTDLSGQRSGMLVLLSRGRTRKSRKTTFVCECDCGKTKEILTECIKRGQRSCGCLPNYAIHGQYIGGRTSPTFSSWNAMVRRCTNPADSSYKLYGARGIGVCGRWQHGEGGKSGFECFLEDMGPRPSRSHSLDRFPENAGNYEPGNCRWATRSEQQNNMRSNRFVVYAGERMTLAAAIRRSGLKKQTVTKRLRVGWDEQRALTERPKQR